MKSLHRCIQRVVLVLAGVILAAGIAPVVRAQQSSSPVGLFEAHLDVGETPKKGSAIYDSAAGEYRVTGGGTNMWGAVDAFHFVWKKTAGDFSLTADIHFIGAGAMEHRKAALIVRQNLDANSAYADVALHGDGLTALQYRPVAGAETSEVRSPVNAPVRIRLERRGAQLMMYAGKPGGNLTPSGPVTIDFKGALYIGLGVCSHDANVLETAVFSNVRLQELPASKADLNPTKVRSNISVYDLETKSVHVVYSADKLWEAPNWSPDGKYLMANSGGALYRFVLDAKGDTQPEKVGLESGYEANNDHGLSPDGKMLAISADHGAAKGSQVFVAALNSAGDVAKPRLITSGAPSYFHGWSPDGRWLAFVGEREGNFDIYRIPVSGGDEERLTTSPGFDDGPDYSADGKWIYINSNRSGGWDIWRFPASGAGPGDAQAERVTNDAQEDWFPHPSPDGKWIAMLSFPPGTPGHDTRTSVHLRLMAATQMAATTPAGAAPEDWSDSIQILTQFFGGQGTINVNSWSPDSKKFAFVSYELLP